MLQKYNIFFNSAIRENSYFCILCCFFCHNFIKNTQTIKKINKFLGYLQKELYLCTRIRKDAGVVDRAALEMR